MQNEVRLKIGEIEFEAKGDAEIIERERNEFFKVLPLAVDAMMRTRISVDNQNVIVTDEYQKLPESTVATDDVTIPAIDLSRSSLAEFIASKGAEAHNDFIICAAYFDEMKNGVKDFSSDNIKKYYGEARKTEATNVSQYLRGLAQKGLIIDSPDFPGEMPKKYRLSNSGIKCVEAIQPKEGKEKKTSPKPRKARTKIESLYVSLNIDELNLKNYPDVKSFKDFKDKMMLILYIITNEKKGEWFTVADIEHIMNYLLGEKATAKQISGLFDRKKLWFLSEKTEGNKALRRKLLNAGIDYAKSLATTDTPNNMF
jgi:hypothetical protein